MILRWKHFIYFILFFIFYFVDLSFHKQVIIQRHPTYVYDHTLYMIHKFNFQNNLLQLKKSWNRKHDIFYI